MIFIDFLNIINVVFIGFVLKYQYEFSTNHLYLETCIGFYRIILVSIGLYRILQDSIRILQDAIGSYGVLKDSVGFYGILQGSIGFYRMLQDSIGILSDPIGSYRILQDPIGSYMILQDPIGSYRILQPAACRSTRQHRRPQMARLSTSAVVDARPQEATCSVSVHFASSLSILSASVHGILQDPIEFYRVL